jgi:hypothetical protein
LNVGDSVTVNYSSYDTFEVTDDLIGQDSRGPYSLSNTDVLADSETVIYDRNVLNPAVDYTLENTDGKLQFFYPIKYPTIITVKYRVVRMDSANPTAANSGSPFNFGVTYLDEYAKGQEDEM